MGRKPKLTHHQRQEAIARARRNAGGALVDIARSGLRTKYGPHGANQDLGQLQDWLPVQKAEVFQLFRGTRSHETWNSGTP
jgi:hypothetical protein